MRYLMALFLCACVAAQAQDYSAQSALPNPEPEEAQLLAIERAGDRLVAAGERGLIVWSDDNGRTWSQSRVPVSQTLTALSFPTDDHGWAVGHGGVILHSGDGGKSWQQQFDGESANQQWLDDALRRQIELNRSIQATTDEKRVVLEEALEEVIYEIEDTELALESGPADPFLDVMFIDTERGWAVGAYGLLFETRNGGLQWQIATAGIENMERYHYYSLDKDSAGVMYLSGEAGLLYRSTDKGQTWERLGLDYDGSLFGVFAVDDGVALTFGLRGNIFRSADGGESWERISPDEDRGLSFYGGMELENGGLVLVGAGGVMASSTDKGATFHADVHTSRGTFSSAIDSAGDILIVGMSGLVRVPHAR
jgi:photosystem II stability/assembly factor-like uncharacterized protein